MPAFTIQAPDGKSYTVEGDNAEGALAALKKHLSGTDQGAATPAPDKYQQAAQTDIAAAKASGADEGAGLTRRLAHGATLGADSTILAGLETPLEMIKRGTLNPVEGYNYAKAREDQIMQDARKNTGALGTAAEILGGGVSGGGLASGGVTTARMLPQGAGFLKRALSSAADSALLGGFSGAMEGNGLQERAKNAATGAFSGAAVGGALPIAGALLHGVSAPIFAYLSAQSDPTAFAQSQVARAIHESGVSPDELSLRTVQAGNEGQPQFTLADALGNPGQRMLSTIARAPGAGRTAVVDAMQSRQGDQGRRLATAFRDAFEAPNTAEKTRAAMVDNANFEAAHNYAPVKRETAPIDVSNPVAIANRAISPAADRLALGQGAAPTDLAARSGIESGEAALRDPIGSALKEARSYLAAPTITSSNVNQAFRAKTNIDQMIKGATEKGQGALVSELMPIRDALDEALAKTSSNYAAARDAYRVAQKRINALDLGKELGGKPGRPEDAIAQFSLLSPEEQQAFRVGYADPYVRDVQNAAFGTDKSRSLTPDAVKQEFNAFAAPGRADLLQRQIGREQTMFETRNTALGGSKTADNLNDHAAMSVDPHLIGQIVSGNWHGALRTAVAAGHNALTGNTPAVRQEVARILLQNGSNVSPAALRQMVDRTVQRLQFVQNLARGLGRGVTGGLAIAAPGQLRSQ